MLDSTRYPSASTAAAVSSHELSIPSTTIRALPPKSAPGAENTKGGGTTPTAFALRPATGSSDRTPARARRRRRARGRRPARRRCSTARDTRRPAPRPPSRRTSSRSPAPPSAHCLRNQHPAPKTRKAVERRPPPSRCVRLPGRRLRRRGRLRLRLARVRTLLLDQSHGLDDVQRALQLHVLLEVLHRVGRRQWPLLGHGFIRRLYHDVQRDALAVDRA